MKVNNLEEINDSTIESLKLAIASKEDQIMRKMKKNK